MNHLPLAEQDEPCIDVVDENTEAVHEETVEEAVSTGMALVDEAVRPEEQEPTHQAPIEETSTKDEDNDTDSSTEDVDSLTRAADYSTIVGAGDLTFCDDDTAVATVATVLGRGRQRQVIQQILEEEPVSTKEEARVSFAVEPKTTGDAGLANRKKSPDSRLSTSSTRANVTIMGCNETLIDDDTIVNADVTIIGRGRQQRKVDNSTPAVAHALSPELETSREGNMDETASTSPGEHTVKEIIVDTSASSCSADHDDTASDVSILDSTIASSRSSFVKEQAEDETTLGSLLVTPVLDRYRLEADDTSIGVKVVPNERGGHHAGVQKQKQKNLLTKYGAPPPKPVLQATKPNVKATPAITEDAPSSTSPYVTQRTRIVYRKTPHPKRAGAAIAADENKAPNHDDAALTPLNARRLDRGTKSKGESLRSPFTRVSLPELTHRPYRKSLPSTARRLPFSASKAQPERRHTISFKDQSSMSRTPLTAAWVAKHMPEQESSLVDSLDASDDTSFSASFISTS